MIEKSSFRVQRVNELIFRELTILINSKLNDPRLQSIKITEVITNQNLSSSLVFFSIDKQKKNKIKKLLDHASSFLRKELAANLKLRYTPLLQFKYDDVQNSAYRIDNLLAKL